MRRVAAAVLGTAAFALAGCGGGSTAAGPADVTSSGTPSPAAPSSASASASTAPPSSATPSTPASSSPSPTVVATSSSGCAATALKGAIASSNGGAGHEQVIVALTNAGSAQCTLTGYPDLRLASAGSQPAPTTVVHGKAMSFPDTTAHSVTLQPRQTASFDVEYSDVPHGSGDSCTQTSVLLVSPPGASGSLSIPFKGSVCEKGTLHISPVVAGSSGV